MSKLLPKKQVEVFFWRKKLIFFLFVFVVDQRRGASSDVVVWSAHSRVLLDSSGAGHLQEERMAPGQVNSLHPGHSLGRRRRGHRAGTSRFEDVFLHLKVWWTKKKRIIIFWNGLIFVKNEKLFEFQQEIVSSLNCGCIIHKCAFYYMA